MNKLIAVNNVAFEGNESKYLLECINTGWLSSEGPFVERFENEFSKYIGRSCGISVSNGSAALDVAVRALKIGPGDEVIIPTFTIISPALSLVKVGAIPVLVDSNPTTWNMDVLQIEARITSKTKAILIVHIYGLPVDVEPILRLAKKYNLRIIEDAAEMHGQTYLNKKCGSFGDISIFSFYANKLITTGEGGMLLCDDTDLAYRCKKLRNLSFEPDGPRFVHNELGYNYRMTNLQAAIGVAQLEQVDIFIKKKILLGNYYQDNLQFLERYGYQLPLHQMPFASNIYWVFGLLAPNKIEKDKLLKHLSKNLIGHRPFFWCMHEQPVFTAMGLFENEIYPVAEHLARCGFYIPSGLALHQDELESVVQAIKLFYQ